MFKRVLLLVILLAVLFGGVFYLKQQQMQKSAAQTAQMPPPATVAATHVTTETWQPTLHSIGNLVAINGIEVSAEVGGIVSEIAFESGQQVTLGSVLARLDAQVDKAELVALRADQRLTEIEYKRLQELLPKKAVSKSAFDTARAANQSAVARVTAQEAVVARKTIRAPFTGLLGIRKADIGQYLNPGEGIVGLQALDPIYVDYRLPERYYQQLRVGQPVEVRLDAIPETFFNGAIAAIDSAILEGTRTVQLRAELENPAQILRPGMFADVKALQGEEQSVLTVPHTAISYNTYGDFVLRLSPAEAGLFATELRQVETGQVRAGRVVIHKGLQAGDQVIRAGLNKVMPGLPVRIDNSVSLDDADINNR